MENRKVVIIGAGIGGFPPVTGFPKEGMRLKFWRRPIVRADGWQLYSGMETVWMSEPGSTIPTIAMLSS